MTSVSEFIAAAALDGQKIERLIRNFYTQLPSRDVFIDGGAHEGYHTTYARRFFSGRVISVEASPKTYIAHIKRQIALQQDRGLCEVIPMNSALGSREKQGETIDFFFSETHPGRSTVNTRLWDTWAKGAVVYDTPIRAAILEIDDIKMLHARGRSVDFIKLDLEGNEINTLRGAYSTLAMDRPAVVMEFGLKPNNETLYGETCASFATMMDGLGYSLYAPWGEPAERMIVSGYSFWYLFLLPRGPGQAQLVDLLKDCYSVSAAES